MQKTLLGDLDIIYSFEFSSLFFDPQKIKKCLWFFRSEIVRKWFVVILNQILHELHALRLKSCWTLFKKQLLYLHQEGMTFADFFPL